MRGSRPFCIEQGIPIFRSIEKNFLQEGRHEGKRPEKHYPPVFPPDGKERKKTAFLPYDSLLKTGFNIDLRRPSGQASSHAHRLHGHRRHCHSRLPQPDPSFGSGRPGHATRPPCRQAPGAYSPGHQKYCQGSGHSRAPAAFPAQPGCAEQPQETESGSNRRHGVRADSEPGSD